MSTTNARKQKAKVTQSTRLIVGTPGRILDQFAERKLKGVTTIVLDEPDPILATQGADYLREILSRPEPKVQLIFAAATLGRERQAFGRRVHGRRAGPHPAGRELRPAADEHHASILERAQREHARTFELAHFIEEAKCKRAIVFVNQPNLIRHLFRFLGERRLKPVSLSTDRSKLDRQNALRAFGASEARVLITTDQAMTGIDIPDVEWVLALRVTELWAGLRASRRAHRTRRQERTLGGARDARGSTDARAHRQGARHPFQFGARAK